LSGPIGVFENVNFATGTNEVAQMLANATAERGVITIVGGGDSVAAINKAGLGDRCPFRREVVPIWNC
jgi:3-phosphoglycerate kinase